MSATVARRAKLADIEAELTRLRERYDQLMNAFRFDEARKLADAVAAAEREHAALTAQLSPPALDEGKPYTVARPRRRRGR